MSINLPNTPRSYWREASLGKNFPKLEQNMSTDICIVGGGAVGILCAHMLKQHKIPVILLDAGSLCNGVTSCTTAKITAQHDLIYDELIRSHGVEKAQIYYKAQEQGLHFIKDIVSNLQIDCDFIVEDACLYSQSDSDKIEREYRAYQTLNIPSELSDRTNLPFAVKSALWMKDQARFHPLAFLNSLIEELPSEDCHLFENTVAVEVKKDGEKQVVTTKDGATINCKKVVVATHFPFIDQMGFYFARLQAEKSYILALKTNQPNPTGMYISTENPKRSIRQSTYKDDNYLLIGGESHTTGQGESTVNHYKNLLDFANQHFDVNACSFHWSTQDLVSTDKLPFVGEISGTSENILVATGFRKWGMTNSAASAKLITDIITEKDNDFKELVSPSRFGSLSGLGKNIISVSKELISGKVKHVDSTVDDLPTGKGGIVTIDGKKCGAYRDADNKLHVVDTTCTHMGCELSWNQAEDTWDCPCHGSRFHYDGSVIEGPAKKCLKKINLTN